MAFRKQTLIDPITGQPTTAVPNQVVAVRQRRVLVALAGLLALALSACGTSGAATTTTTTTAPATDQGRLTVTIQDLTYTPETLTVPAGATVTWVWRDGAIAHDVKGDDFRSEVVSEGTFRHRFDQPGTHHYLCTLHPNMTGTIEVTR
jgi:plastocyanin